MSEPAGLISASAESPTTKISRQHEREMGSPDAILPLAANSPPAGLPPGWYPRVTPQERNVRTWSMFVPPSVLDNVPGNRLRPLLIVLHGAGATGADMRGLGFEPFAESVGALLVYPNGVEGSWNDGRVGVESAAHRQPVDDVGFLRSIVEESVRDAAADPSRVFVVGFSNGAMMAGRAACDLSGMVAGVALVGGAGPADLMEKCRPTRAVPVAVVFGSADPVVPYNGGTIAPGNPTRRGNGIAVPLMLGLWSARDGCTGRSERLLAGGTVVEIRAIGCQRGAAVLHYRVEGGGHEWFDRSGFSTTKSICEFFLNASQTATA